MRRARHLVPMAAAAVVALAAAGALAALGAAQRGPGVAWLLAREPAPALQTLLAGPGTRLVALWAGGRIALLRAEALDAMAAPPGAWLLRTPLPGFALAGCG